MIRKHIFGGCNLKTKTSYIYENFLYFCSSSNILISSSTEIENVIFLDNFLNFVKVSDNIIISGDIKGTFYVIEDKSVNRYKFDECIQDGCLIDKDLVLVVFLKQVLIYNLRTRESIDDLSVKNLISTCSVHNGKILIGTTEGSLDIYDLKFNLICRTQCHDDRIQDIACTTIINREIISTCSKDNTIKIWELENNYMTHKQTLVGHNDWVNQINWSTKNEIVSSSSDKTIMIWKMTGNFVWENVSILGGAKPFLNGFYMGDSIVGQSLSGSFYKFDEIVKDFISGHTDEIMSLDWNGEYLLSTSLDKTARIFVHNREIGRPLIHGYELSAGKFLNEADFSIIVGGQETIIRALEPTFVFYLSCEWKNLESKLLNISINPNKDLSDDPNKDLSNDPNKDPSDDPNKDLSDDPNKDLSDNPNKDLSNDPKKDLSDTKNYFEKIDDYKMVAVPAELSLTNDAIGDYNFENVNEYLLSTTTFNEIKKMYGHYFEISDIDVSKNYIASCNKSLTKKFSGIFLWNKNFEILDYLEIHSYGIIKLKFSPDEKYLCAVSKDKTSSVYEINKKLCFMYRNTDHKRVVWDCSFSFDSKYYATCSRDRKIFIYDLSSDNQLRWCIELANEVTSLDFSPKMYTLAAGTESGEIFLIRNTGSDFVLDRGGRYVAHSQRINALKFNKNGDLLASGGKDGLINIFRF
jgi:elongator complex protein 2